MNKFENALIVASRMRDEFESLRETVIQELGTTNNCCDLDVTDFLDSLVNDLIAATDGRPKPLDLSSYYSNLEALGFKPGTKSYEHAEQERDRLKRWAECYSPGNEFIAYVGDKTLRKEDLLALRKWVDEALTYHERSQKSDIYSA